MQLHMIRRLAFILDLGDSEHSVTDTLQHCLALRFRFETERFPRKENAQHSQAAPPKADRGALAAFVDSYTQRIDADNHVTSLFVFVRIPARSLLARKWQSIRLPCDPPRHILYYALRGEASASKPDFTIDSSTTLDAMTLALCRLPRSPLGTRAWSPYRVTFAKNQPLLDLYVSLAGGESLVKDLIYQMFPHYPKAEVSTMSQGASLSRVFKLTFPKPVLKPKKTQKRKPKENFILKVTPSVKSERVQLEWDARQNASDLFQDKDALDEFGRYFPSMHINHVGCFDDTVLAPGIARKQDWVAAAYKYIGKDFICLEQLYCSTENFDDLQKHLTLCLDTLYGALQRLTTTVIKTHLWLSSKGGKHEEHSSPQGFPPYDIRPEKKLEILKHLTLLSRYAPKLIGNNKDWQKAEYDITNVLHKGLECGKTFLTWQSATHGDLNGGNVLFYLKPPKVDFIDLAWFKIRNHALHDYARLECEFKFALLDCGSKVDKDFVRDLAGTQQISWWIEAERKSLNSVLLHHKIERWSNENCRGRCYNLIDLVRNYALRQQVEVLPGKGADAFDVAYRAALLHCTLNSITYEKLPFQKRIFAVLSAGMLIESLKGNI